MSRRTLLLSACLPVLLASPSQAAMQSYLLNQSNIDAQLADGQPYVWLTIDDSVANRLDFTVTVLSPLTTIAASNFGIQTFSFNVAGTGALPLADASASNAQWLLPSAWSASVVPPLNQADGFGRFEVEVGTNGAGRLSPLAFSLFGTGLTASSFTENSTGNAGQGNFYFAAHVTDFNAGGGVTSGYFAGSTAGVPPAAVPLPAPLLLLPFGAAFGLAFLRRSRSGRAGTPA